MTQQEVACFLGGILFAIIVRIISRAIEKIGRCALCDCPLHFWSAKVSYCPNEDCENYKERTDRLPKK